MNSSTHTQCTYNNDMDIDMDTGRYNDKDNSPTEYTPLHPSPSLDDTCMSMEDNHNTDDDPWAQQIL